MNKKETRKKAVCVFYKLGLTIARLANAIEFSESTIANDLTELGGTVIFENRPSFAGGFEKRLDLFSKIFLFKINQKLSDDWWINYFDTRPSTDLIDMIWQGVNKEISLNRLRLTLKGSWRTLQYLSRGILKSGISTNLLRALYSDRVINNGIGDGWRCDINTSKQERKFIHEFLVETLQGHQLQKITATCTNFEELVNALVSIFSEYVLESDYKNTFAIFPIREMLKDCSYLEQVVLKSYFGLFNEKAYTLEEIGEKLNLTRERIRQTKEKALRCMRFRLKTCNIQIPLAHYPG